MPCCPSVVNGPAENVSEPNPPYLSRKNKISHLADKNK